jgi:hypothetical protein
MTLHGALTIMCKFSDNGHMAPDLFAIFSREGEHLCYAREFLEPAPIVPIAPEVTERALQGFCYSFNSYQAIFD